MKKLVFLSLPVIVFTLFFSRTDPVVAEITEWVYNDNISVDLLIGSGGVGKKHELYRDSILIRSWQNQTDKVGYTDYVSPDQVYYYRVWSYTWNEQSSQWDSYSQSSVIEVDTHYTRGAIHNSEEWQAIFRRGPVVWVPGLPYRVSDLYILSGTLEIFEGANVIFITDTYGIQVQAEGRLHADGATFSVATEATGGSIVFYFQTESAEPVIENSTFNDNVSVTFAACTGVEFSNNTLNSYATINTLWSVRGIRVLNNRGGGQVNVGSNYSSLNLVEGNQVDEISVNGDLNVIKQNRCCHISFAGSGSENQIVENIVEADPDFSAPGKIEVFGNNIIIKDNALDKADIYISGDENTVEGNTIEEGHLVLWGAGTNLVKQNNFSRSTSASIQVIEKSHYNHIEDNNICKSMSDGIQIGTDLFPSNSNVIVFNHIWGGTSPFTAGIAIIYGDGNGVHENISEGYYYGISVGAAATNSWVYNNLFRVNEKNAVDDGTNTIWNYFKLAVSSNIVGGPYLGGNYWDDYTGHDADGDKLGDTPYLISDTSGFASATDNLPLIWVSMPSPTPGPTPEKIVIDSGDYNGDGTSDIAIFRGSSGLWAVRGTTRLYFGSADDLPVSGDYNADGTTDISIFRGSSGLWAVRDVTRAYFGTSSDTAVPFRSTLSSACNIAIFRPSSGLWAVKGVTRVYFGTTGDTPVPGNYNGNGSAEVGIFRGASGLWAIRGVTRGYFGSSSDIPVPGDYTGSGSRQIGVFRPSSGLWAIRGVTRVYYGSSEDTPVPANYAGSGSDSIEIFRPSTGLWAARGETRIYYGGSGDIPVTR